MKVVYIYFAICFVFVGCEKKKKEKFSEASKNKIEDSTSILMTNPESNLITGDSISYQDFEETVKNISDVKYTGKKYSDWMTNRGGFIDRLLELKPTDYSVYTTSYSYKDSCVFYLHTLSHNDKQISSIRPFLVNAIGKKSYSKLSERVLIFAMKNDKEANFIDIPPNWGYSKIRSRLIKNVYNNLNSVVISCDTTKTCKFKDLRN